MQQPSPTPHPLSSILQIGTHVSFVDLMWLMATLQQPAPFEWRKPNHQVGYTRENAATYTVYGPIMKGQHKTQFLAL
jgi:hypothetical protein